MDKLKLVKTVVFVITFLLVFGSLTLLGLLYQKSHHRPLATSITSSLGQPAGSTIASFKIDGNEVYLLVKNGGQSDRLIIYNRETDKAVATLKLN